MLSLRYPLLSVHISVYFTVGTTGTNVPIGYDKNFLPRERAGAAALDLEPAFATGRSFAEGIAFGSFVIESIECKGMLLLGVLQHLVNRRCSQKVRTPRLIPDVLR